MKASRGWTHASVGRELLERGLLSENRLATAADYGRAAGIPLAEALCQLGFIDPSLLERIEGERTRAAEIPISRESVDQDLLARTPRILFAQSTALPIRLGDRVIVASNVPIEPLVRDDLERIAGRSLEFVQIREDAGRRALKDLAAELLAPAPIEAA